MLAAVYLDYNLFIHHPKWLSFGGVKSSTSVCKGSGSYCDMSPCNAGIFYTMHRREQKNYLYIRSDSSVPSTYKLSALRSEVHRFYRRSASQVAFERQLGLLKEIYRTRGYDSDIIDSEILSMRKKVAVVSGLGKIDKSGKSVQRYNLSSVVFDSVSSSHDVLRALIKEGLGDSVAGLPLQRPGVNLGEIFGSKRSILSKLQALSPGGN